MNGFMMCICGASFRSMIAEARHRHNYPALCRKAKPKLETFEVVVLYTAKRTLQIKAKNADEAMRKADATVVSTTRGFLEIQETGVKPLQVP